MIDLGIKKPGSTIKIPFATYSSDDPSASVTITGLAVTDIEVYKDLGTTQRASDSGYALIDTDGIDIDGVTGIHAFTIDLSDNTTAGFWAAGSHYTVVVASITVDGATINFIPVTFEIGYPDAILNTTIATLSSQTSFTLAAGPADDDALNGCVLLAHDVASGVQICLGVISDYIGSSLTVTLAADPGIFTMAATDNIAIFPPVNTKWLGTTVQTANDVGADVDAILVDTGTTLQAELDGIQADTEDIQGRLPAALVNGRMDSSIDDTGLEAGAVAAINATVDTALTDYDPPTRAELTSDINSVLAKLQGYVQLLARSDAAIATDLSTELGEINADEGSGAGDYDNATDSQEALQAEHDATQSAVGTVDTVADAIQAVTDNLPDSGALSDLAEVLTDTGTTLPALIAALNDLSASEVNAEVVDVLRTDTLPDSVAADGSASTIAQAIYLILQFLTDKAVSGTTLTVRKPDGSTALATFTLDDGDAPTDITRAT